MEFQKNSNFLDITSDNKDLLPNLVPNQIPKFVTKNELKLMINHKEITMLIKKLELKHQC